MKKNTINKKKIGKYKTGGTVSDMDKAGYKGPEGYYKHFLQWGHREDVSPSAGFDANQYYAELGSCNERSQYFS